MKNLKHCSSTNVTKVFLALSFCLHLPLPTWAAGDSIALLSETPHADATIAASGAPTSAAATAPTYLYGKVKQRSLNLDESAQGGNAEANLQAETPAETRARLEAAAYKKLSQGFDLTSDEYRSLGVGCIGFESLRTFFQSKGKLTAVYKNSPAARAGLKVGETVIQDASDNEAKADPTKPLWSVSLAKEGDPVNIVVVRHGHKESLTILRYNIEDIEEPAIRAQWEKIVRDLGFPKQGTFNGPNMESLHRTSDEAL